MNKKKLYCPVKYKISGKVKTAKVSKPYADDEVMKLISYLGHKNKIHNIDLALEKIKLIDSLESINLFFEEAELAEEEAKIAAFREAQLEAFGNLHGYHSAYGIED